VARSLLTVDEHPLGLSWILDEPMQRACHAIVAADKVGSGAGVSVDAVVAGAPALGAPAGVLQLLDRHNRDCAAVAERFGIQVLRVPDEVPSSPFEAIPVIRLPGWKETALWWPEPRTLVVAEVVGTNSLFNAGRGGVGMHPMLRAWPPGKLRHYEPEHLLTGHGPPVHGTAASEGLELAYARSRRDIPRALLNMPRAGR
jgi:hypothetical protein